MSDKSILDGMKIKEEGFPISRKETPNEPYLRMGWRVVSNCTHCGNPIYGPEAVSAGSTTIQVTRSCNCQ